MVQRMVPFPMTTMKTLYSRTEVDKEIRYYGSSLLSVNHVENSKILQFNTYHFSPQPRSSQATLAPYLNQKGNQAELVLDQQRASIS